VFENVTKDGHIERRSRQEVDERASVEIGDDDLVAKGTRLVGCQRIDLHAGHLAVPLF
jgi:hypothetical protein